MSFLVSRTGRTVVVIMMLGLFLVAPAKAQTAGADLFKAKCAACHSADGSGSGPVGKAMGIPDLSSPEVQKESDAQLIAATTDGKGKMPAYKGKLTDAQITQLVAHIRTLAKK